MIKIIIFSFTLSATVYATDKDSVGSIPVVVSEKSYQMLLRLEKLVEADDCDQAVQYIEKDASVNLLSAYERSQVYNIQSYCYYVLSRYDEAIGNYKKTLNIASLPESMIIHTMQMLVTLMIDQARYDEAAKTTEKIVSQLQLPNPEVYLFQGKVLNLCKRHHDSLISLKIADNLLGKEKSPSREQLILTFSSVYEALGNRNMALKHLVQLAENYTKPSYLKRLSQMFGVLNQEKEQLAILNILFDTGALKSPEDIERLIYLSVGLKNYYRAASVLSRQIENNKMWKKPERLFFLSQTWFAAKEYDLAITSMKRAILLSETGKYYFELAKQYAILRRWKDASHAAITSMEKGLPAFLIDDVNLFIGQSLYHEGKLLAARPFFRSAKDGIKTSSKAAKWLISIDATLKQQF